MLGSILELATRPKLVILEIQIYQFWRDDNGNYDIILIYQRTHLDTFWSFNYLLICDNLYS